MARYCTVEEVKSEVELSQDIHDGRIMGWIDAASAFIDSYCDRHFDKRDAETRYFDGAGNILFIDDLLTVTTFKLDEDGDAVYESSMVPADYVLYPLNSYPKTWVEISSNSNYGGFASGIKKGVQIVGSWGYTTVPGTIRQACLIQVCRWGERSKSGYAIAAVGNTEMGVIPIYTGLDPDIKVILGRYQRGGF